MGEMALMVLTRLAYLEDFDLLTHLNQSLFSKLKAFFSAEHLSTLLF